MMEGIPPSFCINSDLANRVKVMQVGGQCDLATTGSVKDFSQNGLQALA